MLAAIDLATGQLTTIDINPVIAAEARRAVARAGFTDLVTVICGDGYHGHPPAGPFDRILATCSVRGVLPTWLDQLTPDGVVLVPLAHGGIHPLTIIGHTTTTPMARGAGSANFMSAEGPLFQPYPGAHPQPPDQPLPRPP